MPASLTPSERSLRSRIGGLAVQVKHGDAVAAHARRFGPGADEYWLERVPSEVTKPAERLRQAKLAKRLHYAQLAFLSAKARRAKRSDS